jgi:small subunit ribosomal protein S19
MVRKFSYKGKSLEELREMPLKEFIELLPSTQRRFMKRLDDKHKQLIEKIKQNDEIKTHLRDMVILPEMVGKLIRIHNGKEFVAVEIKPAMIGHRFGEFSETRRRVKHSAPGIGATRSSVFTSAK